MQLDNLKREHKNKRSKIVGRGGKRGKTSGRGVKGQTARATSRIRPNIRDIIKKLPKSRGYKNQSFEIKPICVSLDTILQNLSSGGKINPKTLFKAGIIKKKKGTMPKIKILNSFNKDSDFNIKIQVHDCLVSNSAREKIIKAGGEIIS